ncbi:MIP family Ig-specific serine endopeptidase [Mycoplasmopsis gallinacea]|uniref:DUF31 domain-containing protein n=1 Tax=Mycoplasmopsis gallinacea TaxID=29556 RepID=A0A6H0V2F8_9BACT|nr:hypothetical protein [Mycoplasmopsis gallinacea]QIW61869.1 hypothetical protein GOQ20_00050 [Mycoplasmopsis gallinacea]
MIIQKFKKLILILISLVFGAGVVLSCNPPKSNALISEKSTNKESSSNPLESEKSSNNNAEKPTENTQQNNSNNDQTNENSDLDNESAASESQETAHNQNNENDSNLAKKETIDEDNPNLKEENNKEIDGTYNTNNSENDNNISEDNAKLPSIENIEENNSNPINEPNQNDKNSHILSDQEVDSHDDESQSGNNAESNDEHTNDRSLENNANDDQTSNENSNLNNNGDQTNEDENVVDNSSEESSASEDASSSKTAEDYYNEFPNAYKYNDTVPNYYNLSTNNEYLDQIRKRSFSLVTYFDDGTYTAGTLWLLDYKVIKEKDEYKLFFGTNYHVAVELFSEFDYPEYRQPNRNKSISHLFIAIGNSNSVSNGKLEYMEISLDNLPRTFFLARNFMKQEAYPDYAENKVYYTDFAVIEWDLKVSKYSKVKKNIPILKQLVSEAPRLIDESINKVKNNDISMFNNEIPYSSYDYRSFWQARANMIGVDNLGNLNEVNTYEKAQEISNFLGNILKDNRDLKYRYRPNSLFVYGFPSYSSQRQGIFSNVLDKDLNSLNRSDWYSKKEVPFLPLDEFHNKQIADHGAKFNGEDLPYFYGVAYRSDQANKSVGGVSGSLVINQDALPIGVLFGALKNDSVVYLNDENKYVTNHTILFIQFVQSAKLWNENGTIYPYNLIDGRDKTKYPLQINSYKEQLDKIYGSEYKTTIFNV